MSDLTRKSLAAGMIVALAATTPVHAGPNEDAFNNAGYTMCDAALLGAIYEDQLIKRVISGAGEKILNGDQDIIETDLASARDQFAYSYELCPADDFYTPADIELFARYWDMDSRSEAREKISELLIAGAKTDIDEAIEMAK